LGFAKDQCWVASPGGKVEASEKESDMKHHRWQDHIVFIIGMCLIASPRALGSYGSASLPAGAPAWNFHICGLTVAVLGGAAYAFYHLWEERVDILLGGWLVASP
jgi:hypothetical protein